MSYPSQPYYMEQLQQLQQYRDLTKQQILLIQQNQESLLRQIQLKSADFYHLLQHTKKINYLYSDQRNQDLIKKIQIRQQELNKIKAKNRDQIKKKEAFAKQVCTKRKLIVEWKRELGIKKIQQLQIIQKQKAIQQIQKENKSTMNSNAQISQDLKDLNPKIKFLKEKREQLEKKENNLMLKLRKNYIELEFLKNRFRVEDGNNKENQHNGCNFSEIIIDQPRSIDKISRLTSRKCLNKQTSQRKSTQPNSQNKLSRKSKIVYDAKPFQFNF